MLGIFGILSTRLDREAKNDFLKRIAGFIIREPWHDWKCSYSDTEIGMGMIGLQSGKQDPQPVFNEDGTLCLLFYGRLYAYEASKQALLRKGHQFQHNTDAEFLLHLYEERGITGLADLNGAFVCSLWDVEHKKLLLINDRYGTNPLYYRQDHSGLADLVFAPSVTALLRFVKSPQIDEDAVADLLTFEHILGSKTLASDIQLLPPGSVLTFDLIERKTSITRYWEVEFSYDSTSGKNTNELVAEVVRTFQQAVIMRYQEPTDSETALALSGGMDSRAIASALSQAGYKGFYTFSFGIPGCTDREIASILAKRINAVYNFFISEPEPWVQCMDRMALITDGQLNVVDLVGFPFYPEFRTHFSAVLSGFGGEFTRGWFYDTVRKWGNLDFFERLYKSMTIVPEHYLDIFDSTKRGREMLHRSRNSLKIALEENRYTRKEDMLDVLYLQQRTRRYIFPHDWVLGEYVETETPFLDSAYIDAVLRVPPSIKNKSGLHYRILERLSPTLQTMPFDKGMSVLSKRTRMLLKRPLAYYGLLEPVKKLEAVFHRREKRVIENEDFDGWFRGPLRQTIESILLDQRTCDRWGYNKSKLERLLMQHMNGADNLSRHIGALVTLELWRRHLD